MSRKVNEDEIRAKHYLKTIPHTTLTYEPLGNVTPDFVLDNTIAVEVRRLNKNYLSNDKLVRIENTEIPLDSIDIEELYKNIQLIIDEKNKKITPHFELYKQWWLILIDHMTHAMHIEEFEEIKKMQLNKHKFSKVIILSPDGDFKAFKL